MPEARYDPAVFRPKPTIKHFRHLSVDIRYRIFVCMHAPQILINLSLINTEQIMCLRLYIIGEKIPHRIYERDLSNI
ncbi:hypothetical protein BRARA_A03152 [Brassica rapa]|uniref:Uncharacterized protein n=1 Tax=Brassica campestris TaxID=3711 RepID=A0A398ASC3_BRACM|nr:hypothetical protein BRARA_A03152 [Brassica rapa]